MKTEPEKQNSARIALMLPRFSLYGGVEQFGFRLAAGLAERGHAVDFICARREQNPPPGVRVLCVGRPFGPRFLKMLWFLIQAEKLRKKGAYDLSLSLGKTWRQDLIRMGGGPLKVFWEKSEAAIDSKLKRGLKKITRRLSFANLLTIFIEKRQFTRESRVIAVSHLVRDWLLGAYPELDPDKVSVIYNQPDTTRFTRPTPEERAKARRALWEAGAFATNIPKNIDDLIFIGTASTNFQLKGVDKLIRAMALLPEKTLLFIAGGRAASPYIALAASLGLENRVVFTGKTRDMPAFYKALDIFALPTFYDACSNVVLEALASGCRTLTSTTNGASFFLGKEALLHDPADVPELAGRLRIFMDKARPEDFVWPLETPSGLWAFMEEMENILKKLRSTPA